MRNLLASCALLALIITVWLLYSAATSRPDSPVAPVFQFYAACSSFTAVLLCGYGARALSYMAEQSNALKRMAATLEAMEKASRAVDPVRRAG